MKVGWSLHFVVFVLWLLGGTVFSIAASSEKKDVVSTKNLSQTLSFDSITRIDLSRQKIQFNDFPFYVEDVFSGQIEKEILGFITEGHVPIAFEKDLLTGVKSFLQNQFPFDKSKMPLLVRLNRVSILTQENVIRTNLSLSFFVRREKKIILLLNTAHVRTHSISVFAKKAYKIADNLKLSFQHCFQDFLTRHQKNSVVEREISELNLSRLQIDALNFPIIDHQKPVKGVYHSYSEFMDNQIDTTVAFRMFQIMPSDTLVKKAKFEQKKHKSIWGLCDGKHYYMRYEKSFHRITYNRDKRFFEICFRTKDFKNNSGDVETVFFFGLAGLAIKRILEVASSIDLVLPLDLATGMIYFLPQLEKNVIIECVGKGERDEIALENSDGKICVLNKGEFFKLKTNSLDGIIRLQLKSAAFEREIIFDPMTTQRILIEHKPHKIAVEFPVFVDSYALRAHLKKNRKEVFKTTALKP